LRRGADHTSLTDTAKRLALPVHPRACLWAPISGHVSCVSGMHAGG
jgi:hypothetical protein